MVSSASIRIRLGSYSIQPPQGMLRNGGRQNQVLTRGNASNRRASESSRRDVFQQKAPSGASLHAIDQRFIVIERRQQNGR